MAVPGVAWQELSDHTEQHINELTEPLPVDWNCAGIQDAEAFYNHTAGACKWVVDDAVDSAGAC